MRFQIIITSDVTCPFCVLGLKRLERAIEVWHATAARDDTFDIRWRPFYLSAPAGMGKRARMESRFSAERAALLEQKTREKGEREGVKIGFDGSLPTGGTRDAHRLIAYTEQHHPQSYQRIVHALFVACHEKEEDVSELDVLIRTAVEAGMVEDEIKAFLEGDSRPNREDIDAEARLARERGITGVPYFEINGQRSVDGAYEPGEWLSIFAEVRASMAGI